MTTKISPLAGKLAPADQKLDVAGATFLRRDGTAWTTDKDGIAAALLSAEITAPRGQDPAVLYHEFAIELGDPVATRVEAPANAEQKRKLARLSAGQVRITELAGEPVQRVLDHAPGNDAPWGGIKVVTANAWFAARPSDTEDIYKIYAESFRGADQLERIVHQAQTIVDAALAVPATAEQRTQQ
jgi:phosphoglucomutase